MVLPRMGAGLVIKKLTEEVMATPKPAAEPEPAAQPQPAPAPPPEVDEIHGSLILDENDEPVGTAHRIRSVAFYLVSDSHGDLLRELDDCLQDRDRRELFIRDERGRLTAVILAPHPDRMPAAAEALRADDI